MSSGEHNPPSPGEGTSAEERENQEQLDLLPGTTRRIGGLGTGQSGGRMASSEPVPPSTTGRSSSSRGRDN